MLLVLMAAAFGMQHMYAQHDKDNYNQWASMEYKQWKFTPESYYYSWYKKKIDLGLFSIKIDVPGLGVHDNGPGGIGIGGDGYVDQRWRQMQGLRSAATVTHIMESSYSKKEDEHWNTVYKEDLATYADRSLEVSYSITGDTRNRLKKQITENLDAMDDETAENFRKEYNRILANINDIHNAHMDNAKKIVAYENENRSLEKLAVLTNKVAKIQLMDKFIKGEEE